MNTLTVLNLGGIDYDRALAMQMDCVERVCAGQAGGYLLLAEHAPPVITLGRRGRDEDVLASADRLAAEGIQVRRVSRGGAATYHGPGQIVAYPILSLRRPRRRLREYVDCLLAALKATAEQLGVTGCRTDGPTGVWLGEAKIASVGVAIERGVAYHGVALNVCCNLDHFRLIVPCGLDTPVTGIAAQLGRPVTAADAARPLAECIAEALGMEMTRGATSCLQPVSVNLARADKQPVAPGPGRALQTRARLPAWFKKPIPPAGVSKKVRKLLRRHGLATVCEGARCPNRPECFARGTATFMILGDRCTRNCRFCAVDHGPQAPPRPDEPEAVARAAAEMGLSHVVITSVTRDDLPDGGSGQFARTVRHVRRLLPAATVEVLTPDFQGDPAAVERVCSAGPDVFNHNVETAGRLYPAVRPQARYARSLEVLACARRLADDDGADLLTKSGMMVGLGETDEEVRRVMADLRRAGCDLLTIGQYLQPTPRHLPVARFVPPDQFDAWRDHALTLGFRAVAAAPHVRSSYHAESFLTDRRR